MAKGQKASQDGGNSSGGGSSDNTSPAADSSSTSLGWDVQVGGGGGGGGTRAVAEVGSPLDDFFETPEYQNSVGEEIQSTINPQVRYVDVIQQLELHIISSKAAPESSNWTDFFFLNLRNKLDDGAIPNSSCMGRGGRFYI